MDNQMTKGSFHNYNAELVNLLAFLIGALIVVLGLLCETSYGTFGIIMISIGSSIIASSIIVFISSRYQIKKNITQELIEHWGLIGIFKTRAGMNQRADATLTKLRNELDMVAFGLKSFRNVQGGLIERKVKRGLKIRILTMNPNSQIVKQREIDEGEVAGQIKKTILDLENWIIKLLSLTLFDLICLKNSDEHFTPPMVGSKPLSDRLLSSKLFFHYFIFPVDI
jgi:hypothetical protein